MDEENSCSICFEKLVMIGVGKCEHKMICALCHYKMRIIQKTVECGVCKSLNEVIVITSDLQQDFKDYDLDQCVEYKDVGTVLEGIHILPRPAATETLPEDDFEAVPFRELQGGPPA